MADATALEHTALKMLVQSLGDTEHWIEEYDRSIDDIYERLSRLCAHRDTLKTQIHRMAQAIGEPIPDEAL